MNHLLSFFSSLHFATSCRPIVTLLTIFTFISCQQSEQEVGKHMVNVTVSLSGFDIIQTRASDKTAADAKVNTIVLKAFDASGNEAGSVTQVSTASDFGSVTLKLPAGTYKFVAVACKSKDGSSAPVINSTSEVSFGKVNVPYPIYNKVQDVTISGNTSQAVSIDMGTRVNALFTVKITDTTPSDVASLQIIVNPSSTAYDDLKINPTTGLATTAMQFSGTMAKTATTGGTFTNYAVSLGLLLTSDTENLDVTINALDASGAVLYTRTLQDVTFTRAYNTYATGTFFSSSSNGSLLFDTTITKYSISLD